MIATLAAVLSGAALAVAAHGLSMGPPAPFSRVVDLQARRIRRRSRYRPGARGGVGHRRDGDGDLGLTLIGLLVLAFGADLLLA